MKETDNSYEARDLPFNYIINSRGMPSEWQGTILKGKK